MSQSRETVEPLAKLMARSPELPVIAEFGVVPLNHDRRGIPFTMLHRFRSHWSTAWLPVGGGEGKRGWKPGCCVGISGLPL